MKGKLAIAGLLLGLASPHLAAQSTAQQFVSLASKPHSGRDYFNELRGAQGFIHYTDEYVCFHAEDGEPGFTVIAKGADVIEMLKHNGEEVTAQKMAPLKNVLIVQTYYKGTDYKLRVYKKDNADESYSFEFDEPILHGKMTYSINWLTGLYRLKVFSLDQSQTVPILTTAGKCELIHPEAYNGQTAKP